MNKTLWLPMILFTCTLLAINCADYDILNEGDPEPVKLEITAATDSTVTLRWTKSHDEYFSYYKVLYSKNDVVDNRDSISDSLFFKVDTTKIVRKLTPDTRYYFRVMVFTENGFNSPSNVVDTVTLKDTITDSTEILQLFGPENITSSSVTLRWSECKTVFDRYLIFGDTSWQVDYSDSLFKTVYGFTSEAIEDLTSGKTYWFKIYAQKDTGFVAVSNSVEVNISE